MHKNGPLALIFHAVVVTFMLAPLVVICLVAFTPANTLTLRTTQLSLRWFRAVFEHPDFVASFVNSLWLATIARPYRSCWPCPPDLRSTATNSRSEERRV